MTPADLIPSQITAEWLALVRKAIEQFAPAEFPDELPSDPDEALSTFNRLLAFQKAICEANQRCGLRPNVEDFRKEALSKWPKRKLGLGEERALVTSILYRHAFRLSGAGERDSRMQAAMAAADVFVRSMRNAGSDEREPLKAAFLDSLSSTKHDDETVRKSIKRFKERATGTIYYRLNPDTIQVEAVAGVDLTHGLTSRPGRPRQE